MELSKRHENMKPSKRIKLYEHETVEAGETVGTDAGRRGRAANILKEEQNPLYCERAAETDVRLRPKYNFVKRRNARNCPAIRNAAGNPLSIYVS